MYSIKMRSSNNDKHISGAETLCEELELENFIKKFFNKGFYHENGEADFLNLKIEKIETSILKINALPIYDYCNKELNNLALHNGISSLALNKGFEYIHNKKNYRGAIILSAKSGERLDHTEDKGIRVTNFGIQIDDSKKFLNERVQDAIAIASCINNFKGVKGELCISDDLNYTTGYFATHYSYNRLHNMKKKNTRDGGRIIFIDDTLNLNQYIDFLQKVAKQVIYH